MKTALYIRVSSQEQEMHGYSLDAQEKLLRDYAKKNGMEVYGLYADRGKSANKALHKRTELLRMVKDAENGKFQIIVFKDITRWSRNSSQYWMIQDRLDKAGVSWIAVEQPYLETRTPTGRFQVTVMLGTAQLESENTSQRIRFVQDHRAAQGGVLSGHVPIGYKIAEVNGMKRLVIDEDKRGMVNDLFQYYSTCRNQARTIRYIKEKYGVQIWTGAFSTLIKNPIYKGEYRDTKDYCEPYLSESEWDRIQKVNTVRYGTKRSGEYIFRSLLRCPECGRVLTGNYRGNVYYYRCYYHHNYHICDYAKTHRQQKIEDALLDQIAGILDNTELTDAANDLVRQEESEQDNTKELEKLNRKLLNLKELYIDGDIDRATYRSKRDALNTEITRLETAQSSKPYANLTNLAKMPWRASYLAKTNAEKGEWWRFVLERIEIDGDNYVPVYRVY